MRNILLIVLFLINIKIVSSQDSLLFKYINDYRAANNLAMVKWSDDLYNISKNNTKQINILDSLIHSMTNTYECVFMGNELNSTSEELNGFKSFIKKYFNIDYVEPKNNEDVIRYMIINIIYEWHKSKYHRSIMLKKDVSIGSVNLLIYDIKYKNNFKTIGGKKIYFKSFISHYEGKYIATLNLK